MREFKKMTKEDQKNLGELPALTANEITKDTGFYIECSDGKPSKLYNATETLIYK